MYDPNDIHILMYPAYFLQFDSNSIPENSYKFL